MFRNEPILSLRRVVIVFVIVIAALLALYLLTHGRLIVPSASKELRAEFSRFQDNLSKAPVSSDQAQNIVASGSYSVSVSDSSGNRFISNVEVPRLMMGITAKGEAKPKRVTTIARNSLSDLIYTQKGLSSYEGPAFRQLDPSNITNDDLMDFEDNSYPNFTEQRQFDRQTLVGFERSESGIQPIAYNSTTHKTTYYPLLSGSEADDTTLGLYPDGFTLFDSKNSKLNLYKYSSVDTTTISLKNTGDISESDGVPVLSSTDKYFAVSVGPDFVSSNDNAQDLEGGNRDVRVFSIKDKKVIRSLSFGETPVLSLSLSESGKYIAVSTDTQTGIYNVGSGKVVFIIPHSIEEFRWLNDYQYIARSRLEGIFTGNIKTSTAESLISYNDIRPTSISFIDKGQVFFTGYTNSIPNAEYPDAYKVSLETNATDSDKYGLKEFPHQGNGFYTDYLNSIVTVQLTRYISGGEVSFEPEAKQRAESYIKTKLPTYPVSKIRYVYVDLDF